MNLTHTNLVQNLALFLRKSKYSGDISFLKQIEKGISCPNPTLYIQKIAQISQVRFRRIHLEPNWYLKDMNPFFALVGTDKKSCVVFRHKGQYIVSGLKEKNIPLVELPYKELHFEAYILFVNNTLQTHIKKLFFRFIPNKYLCKLIPITILMSVTNFIFPIANAVLFNNVIPFDDLSTYWQILLLSLFMVINMFCIQYFKNQLAINLILLTNQKGTRTLVDKILRFPMSFFTKISSTSLSVRITTFDEIMEASFNVLSIIITNLFSIISPLIIIFYYQPLNILILLLPFLVLVVINYFFSKYILFYFGESQNLRIQTNELGYQYLSAIDKLILNDAIYNAVSKWIVKFQEKKIIDYFIANKINAMATLNNIFLEVFLISMLLSTDILAQKLQLGSVMAILSSIIIIYYSLNTILTQSSTFFNILSQFKLIQIIHETEIEQPRIGIIPAQLTGAIKIKQLNFYYPDSSIKILDNVSFEVKSSDCIALVGPSGSGKSTLLKCLIGLYAQNNGQIYYDDHPLKTLSLNYLRSQCAFIMQNTQLIQGSIFDNIVLSAQFTHLEVLEICELLGFSEWINSLPMKLHTMVNGANSNISGGQKQLIFLARALIRNPLFLFLDEATSALDTVSQQHVMHAIKQLKMTRIIVAHRLSTIQHANQIFVLDNGKIIQTGTYHKLVNEEGLFKKMAQRNIK